VLLRLLWSPSNLWRFFYLIGVNMVHWNGGCLS
jgi:hypothetical protein